MEHTDAGVHTVLADVERPAEHDPFGDHSERVLAERHTQATPQPRSVVAGVGPARPGLPVQPSGSHVGAREVGHLRSVGGDHDVADRADTVGTAVGVDVRDALEVREEPGVREGEGVQDNEDDVEDLLDDAPLDDPSGDLAAVIDLGLGDLLGEAMEWQERALCAQTDPEAFFPEKGGSTREAKRICSGCEVRAECLEYALENDERFGIWGGMSERERRKQRRRAV